jgi:hypothetical protein
MAAVGGWLGATVVVVVLVLVDVEVEVEVLVDVVVVVPWPPDGGVVHAAKTMAPAQHATSRVRSLICFPPRTPYRRRDVYV